MLYGHSEIFLPLIVTEPPAGVISPASTDNRVDLPEPGLPDITVIFPSAAFIFMLLNTFVQDSLPAFNFSFMLPAFFFIICKFFAIVLHK